MATTNNGKSKPTNVKQTPIPVVPRTMKIVNPDGTPTRSGQLLLEQLQAAITGPSTGGGGGGQPGDATGPVTGFTKAQEVGVRYAGTNDRLVHMTVGFIPIVPTPQPVTYLISADNGSTWVWIGSQRMLQDGQELKVDRLAPGQNSVWKVACVAGNLGGDPTPIGDSDLETLYPGVVRSNPFNVAGLATPPSTYKGITATIGAQINVVSADGLTQYGSITGVPYNGGIVGLVYTDPINTTDFFVRITVQTYDSGFNPLAAEHPYGGTQITGGSHSEPPLLVTYVPGLAWVRYRFYLANRNSQGGGDFSDPTTNTLQLVQFNGNTTPANQYDVAITIPPFTPIDPTETFNVTAVTASEVGPKYQDVQAGLHTTIGVIPTIDADYSSPRTVTIWFDFGNGEIVWQGWFSLSRPGQVVRIGDSTLGTDGVRKSGDIWVPANTAQGNWIVYCAPGRVDKGVNALSYRHANFFVQPVTACLPNGTTAASFLPDPSTNDPIIYSLWDPGIWYWEYYCLQWTPPTIAFDPNFWFTMITVQKGATISGVWTPAPDSEGVNESPTLDFLGRVHDQVMQLPGLANDQSNVLKKFGVKPATWVIPTLQNPDGSTNPYREFRFLLYNVSRLGTDTSGSGGAGTYTLQTSCWPGGADHFILIPGSPGAVLDVRAANPATIKLPLVGGNGLPLTVDSYNPATGTGGIGSAYLGKQSVQAINMAQNSITAANGAIAASAVVDPNIVTLGINKVTYGVSVFAGDVVLSRGLGNPVVMLRNTGFYMYAAEGNSLGGTGLTTHPYVAIQNNGIGLFQGTSGSNPGGSVFLDATNSAITIYSHNGDLAWPYLTINANGLSMVNGPNSLAINTNAMSIVDTQFHNRVDLSSAGITLSNSSTNNKLVITASQIQLQMNNQSRILIDATAGITISNGGTSSVVITNSQVQITTTGAAQLTVAASGITIFGPGSSAVSVALAGVDITGPNGTIRIGDSGTSSAIYAQGNVYSTTGYWTNRAGLRTQGITQDLIVSSTIQLHINGGIITGYSIIG